MILKDKNFWPLFWTQFLGALNDNFLKNALVVMITFKGLSLWGLETESLVALMGGLFILPFFLFSPLAGQISDKWEKSKIIRVTKIWELMIMLLASFGLWFHHTSFLIFCLFLSGVQATFFGPVKYSSLPDLLPEEKLVQGNAYIELGTFLAILIGTILGGALLSLRNSEVWIIATLILVSAGGVWTSYQFPLLPRRNTNLEIKLNPFPEFYQLLLLIREKATIYNSVLGISWFWFFGSAILSLLPIYCKNYLHVDETVVTAFLAMFTIGIGLGSLLCEKLSFHRVELGLVPLGSIGMSLFLADLFMIVPPWWGIYDIVSLGTFVSYGAGIRLLIDLFLLSCFGGFFIVPLYTLIQQRAHPDSRSRVIAANNIMNAVFMVAASLMIMVFYHFNLSLPQIFLILCLANVVVAVYIYSIVPEFTLRFLSWILVHFLYRLRVRNRELFPKEGAAVLVCNHISYVDWLVVASACPRPMRFIMYYKFFDIPLLRYLMKHAGVIPIASSKEDPVILENAMNEISRSLKAGDLVCIFPEGRISRDGELCEFKPGIERIVARDPVPVLPMALYGLWGSLFSFKDGPALQKIPKRILFPVTVLVGQAIQPKSVKAADLFSRVSGLLKEAQNQK
jgi:1-acyl-sn-glycerol-3-phosphate acyltransferase